MCEASESLISAVQEQIQRVASHREQLRANVDAAGKKLDSAAAALDDARSAYDLCRKPYSEICAEYENLKKFLTDNGKRDWVEATEAISD